MFKMKYPTPKVALVDSFRWTVEYTSFCTLCVCFPMVNFFSFFYATLFSSYIYKKIPKQMSDFSGGLCAQLWGKTFDHHL